MKLTDKEIQLMVEAGARAPSGGNVQPWQIQIIENAAKVYLDPKRSSTLLDVNRYASLFAVGAFLENVLITADSLGLKYRYEILEFKDMNSPVVEIVFSEKTMEGKDDLYSFIYQRATNRKLHNGNPVSTDELQKLQDIASQYEKNFRLTAINSFSEKKEVADILGEADAIRNLNDQLFTQMMEELRFSDSGANLNDGIDVKTLELPGNIDKLMLLLKRYPDLRAVLPEQAFKDMAKPLIIGTSHMCCFSVKAKPSSVDMVKAGQAMQRVWLNATKMGLSLHPWTVLPFFILRVLYNPEHVFTAHEQKTILELNIRLKKVFNLTETELPLFVFRLFKGDKPTATSLRIDWKTYTTIS